MWLKTKILYTDILLQNEVRLAIYSTRLSKTDDPKRPLQVEVSLILSRKQKHSVAEKAMVAELYEEDFT